MSMARVIFHVDLDAFFVAVERVLDPSLAGKPIAVGGSTDNRGVVMSASYEARRYGVRSAMSAAEARWFCPDIIFVHGHVSEYRTVSARFIDILHGFTPAVEQVSVDEAYLDMVGTERLSGTHETTARRMRDWIAAELGITASIGIADSKLVAKVASDECKPDGLLRVPTGGSANFLAPMPVRKLPKLGPAAEKALSRMTIRTLGQLAAHPAGPIARLVGPGQAEWLKARAAGRDDSPVVPERDAKSISAETTFAEDSSEPSFLNATLLQLSERVGGRLRRASTRARSVTVKARFYDFTTVTRQCTLSRAVDGDEAIYHSARTLLDAIRRSRRAKLRLIGVGVGELIGEPGQLSLLESRDQHDSRLSNTVDRIRQRFGRDAIRRAAALTIRE
jgi:DNA polymerase-4